MDAWRHMHGTGERNLPDHLFRPDYEDGFEQGIREVLESVERMKQEDEIRWRKSFIDSLTTFPWPTGAGTGTQKPEKPLNLEDINWATKQGLNVNSEWSREIVRSRNMEAKDFMAEHSKGSVRRKFPGDWMRPGVTVQDA